MNHSTAHVLFDPLSSNRSMHSLLTLFIIVSHQLILFYFCSNEDYKQYESSICVRDEPTASWSLLNRPVQLKFDGCEEKLKFPFLLAQLNYEPSKPQLLNVMRKIFHTLTSLDSSESEEGTSKGITAEFSSSQCPTVGPHWERIGFQGLDPRTGKIHTRTHKHVHIHTCIHTHTSMRRCKHFVP